MVVDSIKSQWHFQEMSVCYFITDYRQNSGGAYRYGNHTVVDGEMKHLLQKPFGVTGSLCRQQRHHSRSCSHRDKRIKDLIFQMITLDFIFCQHQGAMQSFWQFVRAWPWPGVLYKSRLFHEFVPIASLSALTPINSSSRDNKLERDNAKISALTPEWLSQGLQELMKC